jgi:hypothetical protein
LNKCEKRDDGSEEEFRVKREYESKKRGWSEVE